jgi:hypothetical protein
MNRRDFETDFSLLRVLYRKRSVSNAVLLQLNSLCVKWCATRVLFEIASMGERKIPRWESHMSCAVHINRYELYYIGATVMRCCRIGSKSISNSVRSPDQTSNWLLV